VKLLHTLTISINKLSKQNTFPNSSHNFKTFQQQVSCVSFMPQMLQVALMTRCFIS